MLDHISGTEWIPVISSVLSLLIAMFSITYECVSRIREKRHKECIANSVEELDNPTTLNFNADDTINGSNLDSTQKLLRQNLILPLLNLEYNLASTQCRNILFNSDSNVYAELCDDLYEFSIALRDQSYRLRSIVSESAHSNETIECETLNDISDEIARICILLTKYCSQLEEINQLKHDFNVASPPTSTNEFDA